MVDIWQHLFLVNFYETLPWFVFWVGDQNPKMFVSARELLHHFINDFLPFASNYRRGWCEQINFLLIFYYPLHSWELVWWINIREIDLHALNPPIFLHWDLRPSQNRVLIFALIVKLRYSSYLLRKLFRVVINIQLEVECHCWIVILYPKSK